MTIKSYLIVTKPSDYTPTIADNLISLIHYVAYAINNPRWYEILSEDFWYWYDEQAFDMCEAILILKSQLLDCLAYINPVQASVKISCDTYYLEIYYG